MNFKDPVSGFISINPYAVSPADRLNLVKDLFEKHKIHHVLVLRHGKLEGIISKSDFVQFVRRSLHTDKDKLVESARLYSYTAEEIMTRSPATLQPSDRISMALHIFRRNEFHAIPVIDDDEVVGIITTHDIIEALLQEEMEDVA